MRFWTASVFALVGVFCFTVLLGSGPINVNGAFPLFVSGVGFGVAAVCQGIITGFRLDERRKGGHSVIITGVVVGVGIVCYFVWEAMKAFDAALP